MTTTERPPRPTPLPVSPDPIPAALKALRHWVTWRYTWKPALQKWDKPPLRATTGKAASSTNPKTWNTFEIALRAYQHQQDLDGIGFVLTEDDGFVGIDLDHCRDPDTGEIQPWALAIVEALKTYAEVSPSGTGVRVWVYGRLCVGGRKQGDIEMYMHKRYLTVTGCHLQDTPPTIEPRQTELDALYDEAFVQEPHAQAQEPSHDHNGHRPPLDDDVLLEKAMAARNGEKFARLWAGDLRDYDSDESRADLGLCGLLAFWTGDAAQIDRLFRRSSLMRDKWDEPRGERTYGQRTIQTDLTEGRETYRPGRGRHDHAPHEPRGAEVDADQIHLTDTGNAQRLVRAYGQDLHYVRPWRTWLRWEQGRWVRDDLGIIEAYAKRVIAELYAWAETLVKRLREQSPGMSLTDAAAAQRQAEVAKIEAVLKWALKSESAERLQGLLRQAQSEPGIPLLPDDVDRDPWLLNVLNSTIDLRTGELLPHRRADLLTKQVPVPYDPNARCPRWEQFLEEVFCRDSELIAFIRRAVGYSLTGDTRERAVFILYGIGRNGKSTFLEILAEMLGDYALRTPTRTFMAKRDESIPNDVAMLKGMRFVHASESGEGKRLDEEFIKDATGRDTLSARFMRAEWFQFKPQFKLWLRTNHKPVIRGTDPAIWDRPRLIPFTVRFEGKAEDKSLPDQLRAELPGILAWAVRGCLSWQINGLGLPKAVQEATADYRAEMDVLGEFLTDRCEVRSDAQVTSKALRAAYESRCEANGEKPLNSKAFGARLRERGYIPEQGTHGVRLWRGVGLQTPMGL